MNATMTYYTLDGEPADVAITPYRGDDDPYTDAPTHVRIYREETGDAWPWHIDGVDATGRYTEELARFATRDEALEHLPVFVADRARHAEVGR